MAGISAVAVKELRDRSGAGMMDCKAALSESGGNIEQAQDWLRAKGLSKAAKKSGRAAADGLIGLALDDTKAALVELNAETDFVARNEHFQAAVRQIADIALKQGSSDVDAVLNCAAPDGDGSVADMITRLIANIGENIQLRRVQTLSVKQGSVAGYVHAPIAENLGRIGVIVGLESDKPNTAETARKVAMHIAATGPASVRREDMDPELLERERSVLTQQAEESGRPAAVIEKMIEGRLQKFFKESVLLEQAFVMDPDKTVGAMVEEAYPGARITEFSMLRLGEGVEKETTSFADEVAQASRAN